jgi:hypothetical protein
MHPTISQPSAQLTHDTGERHDVRADRSQSALRLAREAIAHWRGAPLPSGALASNGVRVSPQALWAARASADLRHWIDGGGFSQWDALGSVQMPHPANPITYELPEVSANDSTLRNASACID